MLKKGTRALLKDGRTGIVQRRYSDSNILVNLPDGSRLKVRGDDIAEAAHPLCERCNKTEPVSGERFCRECRSQVLSDLPRLPSEERGRKNVRSPEWLSHQSHEDNYGEEAMP